MNEPSVYSPSPELTYGKTGERASRASAIFAAFAPTTPRRASTRHRSTRLAPVLVPVYAATAESGTKWSTAARYPLIRAADNWSYISTHTSSSACGAPICQLYQLP